MSKLEICFSHVLWRKYFSIQKVLAISGLCVVVALLKRNGSNLTNANEMIILSRQDYDAKCSNSKNILVESNPEKIGQCDGLTKFGGENEDGKLICTEYLPEPDIVKQSCIIYTIGRTNEFSFEIHAWHNWQNCMIYNFDCERHRAAWRPRGTPNNVRSYPWCIGKENREIGKKRYRTLRTIMNKLGHKQIDLVKIYNTDNLRYLIESFHEYQPVQISLEVDFQADLACDRAEWNNIWSKLTNMYKYKVFGQERNHGCESCFQYSLIRLNSDQTGARKTICSDPADTFRKITREYSGSCKSMERIGGETMFGKNICTEYVPRNDSSCVIYSLGSNKQFQFEENVSRKWPHCKVFTFDCTIKHKWLPGEKPPSYTKFYDWCLGPEDKVMSGNRQFLKLDTIKKMLGHEKIDLLKMDIEGYEYEIVEGFDQVVPVQIAFEVHLSKAYACQNEKWKKFWDILIEKYGYEVVADELHPSSEMKIVADRQIIPGCWQCAEYTIVRKNQKALV